MLVKRLPRESSLLLGRSFGPRALSKLTSGRLRQNLFWPVVNEIMFLAKMMGLELDSNYIDELVADHSQELTTEEFTELIVFHCKKMWRRVCKRRRR
ncbi:hypothetical protein AVEN_30752-1 [Araneus ventricosus]|uniref:Uncharacterized protein n=1 Tax=Araneus ventricosus TaxID=182803 RepID=A0A4Y2RXX1_ARAVE|nr:hypothetical protein AVEN_30752-1 [Araneus ventricosus]